jgi:hypothetical protein
VEKGVVNSLTSYKENRISSFFSEIQRRLALTSFIIPCFEPPVARILRFPLQPAPKITSLAAGDQDIKQ